MTLDQFATLFTTLHQARDYLVMAEEAAKEARGQLALLERQLRTALAETTAGAPAAESMA